jgi:PAS domain S-box-containing protein
MENSNNSRIKLIFLFATIILISLSILSYVRINNLVKASEVVNHTQNVKIGLERTLAELIQAESSQRGYLHSKDAVFLKEFYVALGHIELYQRKIDSLTKDNPRQQQNLAALRMAIDRRIDYLKAVLNAGRYATLPVERWLGGKALMDEVRVKANKMQLEEQALMKKETTVLNKEAFFTPVFTIFLISCAILILIVAYYKILFELKISERLKWNLHEKSVELEGSNKELLQKNKEAIIAGNIIAERENRIQSIVEAAPDAVITLDKEGNITNWNAEAETVFGWGKSEVMGKNLSGVIIPARYRDQHTRGMKRFLESGEGPVLNKPVELYALTKDNTEIPVELKISSSKINEADFIFIGFVRNISKRRQNEEALRNQTIQLMDSNKALTRANKELELFNYISSHDLQEPLRKIQIFASRIMSNEYDKLSGKGQDDFNRMQDAAARMQTLIEDLLAYSRTSTTERKFVNTNLAELVEEVKAGFKEEMQARNACIEVEDMCEANIIAFQFRQLLQNLFSNALKFSRPQKPVHIQVKSRIVEYGKLLEENRTLFSSFTGTASNGTVHETQYCHISVSDNGIGFEPQYKDRIFDIFQRLHNNSTYQGTGIGLAIVKKIVENHNGFINATGQLDRGACFDIYIPR